jgi:hypothetical protein
VSHIIVKLTSLNKATATFRSDESREVSAKTYMNEDKVRIVPQAIVTLDAEVYANAGRPAELMIELDIPS